MTSKQLNRRQVLAGLGAVGFLTVGAGLGVGRRPNFTRYTYAQTVGDTNDAVLRVAWYESYNGTVQETQTGTADGTEDVNATLDPGTDPAFVEEASGPVISLPNVMPGDEGRLLVGLQAVTEPTKVWFRPTLTATAENGINEPERRAGDTTDGADGGELQDAVGVRIFRDNGVAGVGACDGSRMIGEDWLTSGEPTLATVDADFTDGVQLVDCLQPDGTYCLGLEWQIPADWGNEIQGDSVEFALEFVGLPCSETCNPFVEDCGEEAA